MGHESWKKGSWTGQWFAKMFEERPEGCWEWPFATAGSKQPYPSMGVGGGQKKTIYATHRALELDGRPRPEGAFALHSCDNTMCVNPDHLRWGDHAENMTDMVQRGRWAGGRPRRIL